MNKKEDVKEFPFYPELSQEGAEAAQKLIDGFKEKVTDVLKEVANEVVDKFYFDILPYVEGDSWTSFRNEIMEGFKDYSNNKIKAKYDFKAIRQQIYKENREEIIGDLNQDMVDEIAKLKRQLEMEYKYR